ncbi:Maf-like protein [Hathewaya limosa]|uniref:dTTP/UTP pyrophosphatase n=1 Tax=Hathewaya limosa TaxID=1536 RepID=A0ABU0JR26_HATLI|nr:Maf-like protein [Hathewaya limosa]MDQ0479519.1 septum formation protein [Hathewaya limosa]
MEVILASGSPRRQELLKVIFNDFKVMKSNFNEKSIEFKGDPSLYVKQISRGKALDVYNSLNDREGKLIIACDTLVFLNGEVLGKPKNEIDAFNMIKALSGNAHKVYSGFIIYNTTTNEIIEESCCTEVRFIEISDEEINNYIKKGDCFDKAGAYGIQGEASIFVEKINGCYFNVVGLPLNKLYKTLRGMRVI